MCITYIDTYMHMSIYTFFFLVTLTLSLHQQFQLQSLLNRVLSCLPLFHTICSVSHSENPGTQQYQLIHLFAQSCNSSSIGSKLLLHLPLQKNNPRKSSGFICCFVPVIQSIQSNMVFINFLNQLFLSPTLLQYGQAICLKYGVYLFWFQVCLHLPTLTDLIMYERNTVIYQKLKLYKTHPEVCCCL